MQACGGHQASRAVCSLLDPILQTHKEVWSRAELCSVANTASRGHCRGHKHRPTVEITRDMLEELCLKYPQHEAAKVVGERRATPPSLQFAAGPLPAAAAAWACVPPGYTSRGPDKTDAGCTAGCGLTRRV